MAKKRREFVDKDHEITDAYHDFLEATEGTHGKKIEKKMKEFIKKDPLFFDPYTILAEELQRIGKLEEAEKILDKGYVKAIDLITDQWGNWPDELHWEYLENRHIIRVILNKALSYWIQEARKSSIDLLRKLLHSNCNDNIGARNYMLAILLGWSFDQYENEMQILGGFGYDGQKVMEFEKRMVEFPEEFGWWLRIMGE